MILVINILKKCFIDIKHKIDSVDRTESTARFFLFRFRPLVIIEPSDSISNISITCFGNPKKFVFIIIEVTSCSEYFYKLDPDLSFALTFNFHLFSFFCFLKYQIIHVYSLLSFPFHGVVCIVKSVKAYSWYEGFGNMG